MGRRRTVTVVGYDTASEWAIWDVLSLEDQEDRTGIPLWAEAFTAAAREQAAKGRAISTYQPVMVWDGAPAVVGAWQNLPTEPPPPADREALRIAHAFWILGIDIPAMKATGWLVQAPSWDRAAWYVLQEFYIRGMITAQSYKFVAALDAGDGPLQSGQIGTYQDWSRMIGQGVGAQARGRLRLGR